ncbi:MAG: oligosaccharide flippase family protein, partial [Acidimicrobiia bacterium]
MSASPPTARTHQLRRLLAQSAAGTTASRVLGAGGGVAAARLLTPAGRGDLALLVVIASIGSLAGASGIQFWIAREVARTHSLAIATHVAVRHSLAIVAGFAVVGLLLAPLLVPRVVGASEYVATLMYATTGAIAFAALAIPNGDRSMGTVAAALSIGSVLYLVGTLALLVLGQPNVAAVLGFATLGNVATVVVVIAFVRARTSRAMTTGPRPIGAIWKGGVRYGLPGGVGELVSLGMLRIDFLLVGAFLPLRAVAIYAVATALTELLWVIPDATAQVVLPTAADADTASGSAPVFRVSTLATIVGAIVLCVLARPLLDFVFGPAYAQGAVIVPYLALAA